MNDFVKERDAAFIHFVKTDDLSKVRAYCKKWDVQMPKSKKVAAAGVYKAVIAITSIPEDIRMMAMQKCLKLGFNPIMKPYDYDLEGGQDDEQVMRALKAKDTLETCIKA